MPWAAAQHLDQRPASSARWSSVSRSIDFVSASTALGCSPSHASTRPRLNHAAGSSGVQLGELLEGLAGVGELAGGEVGSATGLAVGRKEYFLRAGAGSGPSVAEFAVELGADVRVAGLEVGGPFQRGPRRDRAVQQRLVLVDLQVDVGERSWASGS